MAHRLAKVVEATRDEHDPVSKPRLRVAEAILDDPYALHSRQNMLHHHTDLADHAIMLPLRFASLHPCLLLDWLEYHDFCRRERLKTGILMQLAIRRKSIRGSLGQGFVVSRTRPVPLKKRTFRSPRSPMTTFLSVCVFFTAVVCTLHRIVRGTLSRALGSVNHKAVAFTRGEYAFACGGVTSGQKEIPLQRCLPHVG